MIELPKLNQSGPLVTDEKSVRRTSQRLKSCEQLKGTCDIGLVKKGTVYSVHFAFSKSLTEDQAAILCDLVGNTKVEMVASKVGFFG